MRSPSRRPRSPARTSGRVTLCAALVVAAVPGSAQTVGGRAVREAGGAPVAGVRVLLLHAGMDSAQQGAGAAASPAAIDSAVSNASGVFYVAAPTPGTFQIRLRPPGAGQAAEFDSPPITLAVGELMEREFVIAPTPPPAPRVAVAPPGGRAYRRSEVERPVRTLVAAPLEYPHELRDRPPLPSHGGTLRVQFVVDTVGSAEMSTFRVLQYPDVSFISPVRTAIMRSRYEPARLAGRPVRQLVEQTFRLSVRTMRIGGFRR